MNALALGAAAILAVAALGFVAAKAEEPGFTPRQYEDADGNVRRYQVYVPPGYCEAESWPLVVFLHGAGERGVDNEKQIAVGLAPAIRKHPDWVPAVVLLPQAQRTWQQGSADHQRLLEELARVEDEFNIDPARIYVTGLSMGGRGTWDLVKSLPEKFAAAVPICGFFDDEGLAAFQQVPSWFFHGDADEVVSVEQSRRIVDLLRQREADVRYTEYPEVGHHSWVPAYQEKELFDWMFRQRRTQ